LVRNIQSFIRTCKTIGSVRKRTDVFSVVELLPTEVSISNLVVKMFCNESAFESTWDFQTRMNIIIITIVLSAFV